MVLFININPLITEGLAIDIDGNCLVRHYVFADNKENIICYEW